MKIKFNEEKGTYSIKGLEEEHMRVLATLLWYTRLGSDYQSRSAAADLACLLGDLDEDNAYGLGVEIDEYGDACINLFDIPQNRCNSCVNCTNCV